MIYSPALAGSCCLGELVKTVTKCKFGDILQNILHVTFLKIPLTAKILTFTVSNKTRHINGSGRNVPGI